MERTSRKIPVTERQFLWVQDDDKGEVTLHVGPTMVSPTAADRVVIDDGLGGFREDTTGKPQSMIELGDNQYSVLFNPLLEADSGPNGRFKNGRNESRPLRNGTRSMIPGPCSFYLRPGQRVDVRDAHELASNQYLVVKVYGEVDKSAPFYEVTARSAVIIRATAENLTAERSTALDGEAPATLKRGQLIVIRGLDTQFYIPPTGVDIVPDTSIDESGAAISAAVAKQVLAQFSAPEPLLVEEAEAPGQYVDQSARMRGRKVAAAGPPPQSPSPAAPPAQAVSPQVVNDLLASGAVRRAVEQEAVKSRLIRRAVVLGEKEYCVIGDADGKREIKVGPARVFPGPYDTFMTVGSRSRVYDAYELLPQRALWLRVIAPIKKADLAAKLPRGFELSKDEYFPGDELLLTGVSTFFVPFNEIEVLSPESGQAVVGNDHSRVFIEAIGIDQKSGIYVRDLATGEVRLVRGKQSYLVDPRKEVQITRTVPPDDWNLWVAQSEPHKHTQRAITTPWALSITVPNNTAVLVTSANSRRVIEGPCVTLLGYEESLTSLSLSTGTPKSDDEPLRTCFLRTVGNRISDKITVETADFVKISVRVSYSVEFLADHKDRWFNHENYIQFIVDRLRSIVRSKCRTMSLSALWPQLPATFRDTLLGERKDGARPGRLFTENGTLLSEVEVLGAEIEDREVAALMQKVQTESVTLAIGDRKAQEALVSAKLRAEVERQTQELVTDARLRAAKLEELQRKLTYEAALAAAREDEALYQVRQSLGDERENAAQKARLARDAELKAAVLEHHKRDAETRAAAQRVLDQAALDQQTKLRELDIKLIEAQSAAIVAERQAVQRQLVEAMVALGDKLFMTEVANNMNLVSLFKGKDVGSILTEVLGGTKVMPTLRAMLEANGAAKDGGENGA